jgi:hypothetical protein
LARYVSLDEGGKAHLELPPGLRQAYDRAAQQSVFAILDKDGRLVEASSPEFASLIARSPPADAEPNYFQLSHFGPLAQNYSGVGIRLDSAAGPLSAMVAQVSGGHQLVHSILREFVFDIAWYAPVFVAFALALAIYSVRRSLRPLRTASARASDIGPGSISIACPRPMYRAKRCRWCSPSIERSTDSSRGLPFSDNSRPMPRMSCERRSP